MSAPTRRSFAGSIAATAGLLAGRIAPAQPQSRSRLTARPGATGGAAKPGLYPLRLREDRDALLYVPESSSKFRQPPLVVSLHGTGQAAHHGIQMLLAPSSDQGFLLLAPASEGRRWDATDTDFGPDVVFINRALQRTFELARVDPHRIALAGFSAGASYSLSLGLANGDLFHAVLAFSPGFMRLDDHLGMPPVFIAHGTADQVAPIDKCSRLIVPALRRAGYLVTYREFRGRHELPAPVAAEAMRWFMELPA